MRTFLTAVILFASATTTSLFAASHDSMDHAAMNHATMDHSTMNHGAMSASTPAAPVYQTTGIVKAWTDSQVTLAHQPVPALNWPAMTMRFGLNGYQGSAFEVGQNVTFTFKQSASGYDLISVSAH